MIGRTDKALVANFPSSKSATVTIYNPKKTLTCQSLPKVQFSHFRHYLAALLSWVVGVR
jgi:hypothetical protein